MYSVMKAVYDSGIPISFKGSMVLKACLFEAGFLDETRHTVDIDANWNTDTPPMKRFVKCFFELLTQIIVKVRKCKVQRVCVLHFQLAGSGGCFFLMKLYH